MKTKFLLIIILVIGFLTNCKKDNSSSSDIITSKVWKKSLSDKNPSTNPPGSNQILYNGSECEKDDSYTFGNDGRLTINRSPIKCNHNEIQTEVQEYSVNRASKELMINSVKFTLAEESKNQLKYYATIPQATGFAYLIFLLE